MSAQIKDSSIEKFLEELASQGAALVSMVCNLTVGKKKYADVEADMRAVLAKSEALRVKLTGMIEDDVRAFGTVMGAYGMPKETDEQKADRAEAIQKALKVATEVPLACCHASREVIDLAAIAAEKGNLGVISDAGVGVLAAYAALRSAALNVFTNAKMINDRSYAEAKLKEVGQLMDSAERVTEKAYATVKAKVS
jgi:methenyltetrahydrofolate cyclohydrolase